MSSTELATTDGQGSALVLQSDQDRWTPQQVAALRQMGVEKASEGDLAVFLHVSQRTALDPFARQIYMIGRPAGEKVNGQWVDTMKYTIQTGIDGFRVVARRAAARDAEELEYEDTLWCGPDGQWVDVWVANTPPAAARVTILRGGKRFPATVSYAEYVQRKKNGDPTAMWAKMPANQLAKCAEAQALRKAYPQDFAGLYADEEMGQADNAAPGPARRTGGLGGALAARRGDQQPAPSGPAPLDPNSSVAHRMFALFDELSITDRAERFCFISDTVGRQVDAPEHVTQADAEQVVTALEERTEQPFGDVHDADVVEDGQDPAAES